MGSWRGVVYSVDVIGHDEPVNWHGTKQDADEPLAGVEMSRSEIWRRWFAEESRLVTTIEGKSLEVLSGWGHGPIDYAFLDGSHEYEDVKGELAALDSLMAEGGVIVVDDFHLGVDRRACAFETAQCGSRVVLGVCWGRCGRGRGAGRGD